MADKIPTFKWNSEESRKKDFHVFEAALQSHLATCQCRFPLTTMQLPLTLPLTPDQNHLALWMPENGENYTKHSG
jgi:hypothetical protein